MHKPFLTNQMNIVSFLMIKKFCLWWVRAKRTSIHIIEDSWIKQK